MSDCSADETQGRSRSVKPCSSPSARFTYHSTRAGACAWGSASPAWPAKRRAISTRLPSVVTTPSVTGRRSWPRPYAASVRTTSQAGEALVVAASAAAVITIRSGVKWADSPAPDWPPGRRRGPPGPWPLWPAARAPRDRARPRLPMCLRIILTSRVGRSTVPSSLKSLTGIDADEEPTASLTMVARSAAENLLHAIRLRKDEDAILNHDVIKRHPKAARAADRVGFWRAGPRRVGR